MSLDAMASRGSSVAGACCYDNMDCEVSKGWLQNYVDFKVEIKILQEFLVNFKVRYLHLEDGIFTNYNNILWVQ